MHRGTLNNVGIMITASKRSPLKSLTDPPESQAILTGTLSIILCFKRNLPFGNLVYVLGIRERLVPDVEGEGECLLFSNL